MDIPFVFAQFSGLLYPHSREGFATQKKWIGETLESFDNEGKEVLKAYLEELLSGRYTDADLAAIWMKTSPTYNFAPGGHRLFFKNVLEALCWQDDSGVT
jgi:hypothetical protein